MFPKELAGAKRGNLMTFEEADSNRPNPKFRDDYMYRINCQTCVVAYEARKGAMMLKLKATFLVPFLKCFHELPIKLGLILIQASILNI